jgi:hypothetical protein
MNTRMQAWKPRSARMCLAALAAVLVMVFGAIPALAGATASVPPPPPATLSPSASAGMSIVALERIGKDRTFARGPLAATVGEVVHYAVTVTNRDTDSLEITLSDPICDAGTLGPRGVVRMLAAGGSTTFYCSHLLVSDDAIGRGTGTDSTGWVENIATGSGTTASGTSAGPVAGRVLVQVPAGGVLGARKAIVQHVIEHARALIASATSTG